MPTFFRPPRRMRARLPRALVVPFSVMPLGGKIDGTSAVTGDLLGAGELDGSSSASSSAALHLDLYGQSAGSGSTSSPLLTGAGALAGSSTGAASTSSPELDGAGALAGGSSGAASTSSPLLVGAGELDGTAVAAASASGGLLGAGELDGSSSAASSAALYLDLYGQAYGSGSTSAPLLTGAGALAGSSVGSSLGFADRGIFGDAFGAATASATLSELVSVSGSSQGSSSAAGVLITLSLMEAGVDGRSTATGDLRGAGQLLGLTSLGSASASGAIDDAGAAPVPGFMFGYVSGFALATGQTRGGGALAGRSAALAGAHLVGPAASSRFSEAAVTTARDRFMDLVATPLALPVQLDNQPFDPPTNRVWAALQFKDGRGELRGWDGLMNQYRYRWEMRVRIMAPVESQDADALAVADATKRALRWAGDPSCYFETPSTQRVGRVTWSPGGGAYWEVDVVCPFRADHEAPRPDPVPSELDDWADDADAVRHAFDERFVTATGIQAQYDNAPFEPPTMGEPWVRLSILDAGVDVSELSGPRTFRTSGVAVAQVFAPTDEGTGRSMEIVDDVVLALRALRYGSVEFGVPDVELVGRSGGLWQTNVRTPWYSDQVG